MRPGEYLSIMQDSIRRKAGSMGPRDWRALRDLLRVAGSRGTKFVADRKALAFEPTAFLTGKELRPPFPLTVIEFDNGGEPDDEKGPMTPDVIVALDKETEVRLYTLRIDEDVNGGYVVAALSNYIAIAYNDEASFNPITVVIKTDDFETRPFLPDIYSYGVQEFGDEFIESAGDDSSLSVCFYVAFCAALMRAQTELTDKVPDPAASRNRRARGLAPLYTYKVLTINPNKPASNAKGTGHGTHASPRTHLRRGYYRTSKNGVRHWVKSTVVKGEVGFVHKDYRISTETTGAPHYA